MSTRNLNWLKFGALVALAFVLGLFFAGLLDFPRTGFAQQRESKEHAPIIKVDAPHIPAASSLVQLSDAYAAVAEAVRPSVVFVRAERPADEATAITGLPPGMNIIPQTPRRQQRPNSETPIEHSSGSGFIVSSDGYILTNNHVVEGATKVTVRLLDGREYTARTIGTDKATDVGVLKIDAVGLTPAALGQSDKARVGEWVLAIGNPLGDELTFSVTQGIISAKGRGLLGLDDDLAARRNHIQDFIQTDAAINRGNSGGPLVNVRGEVIGINSAIASETGFYAGYAFAVPIDLARKVMDQIIAHGRVERTGLGILVQDADVTDATYFGKDSVAGVVISKFPDEESPAKKAGLEPGDMITAIDGQPVKYVAQLQQVVGFRHPGDAVVVTVERKGGKKEFTVRLTNVSAPADPATPAPDTSKTVTKASATPRNRLGVVVEPMTASLAQTVGLPGTTHGLLVRSVTQGSSAETKLCPADISMVAHCAPDVITEVEGKPVRTEDDLKAGFGAAQHGVVTLTLMSSAGSGSKDKPDTRTVRVKLADLNK